MPFYPKTILAQYFFQQLISGVSYCHSTQMCHRDLKLENTCLDSSPARGSKFVTLVILRPKSTVGTPAYIAPENLSHREYDGKRITIKEIKSHPWFLKNLPRELTEMAQAVNYRKENPTSGFDETKEAKAEAEEDEYEKRVKEAHESGEIHVN